MALRRGHVAHSPPSSGYSCYARDAPSAHLPYVPDYQLCARREASRRRVVPVSHVRDTSAHICLPVCVPGVYGGIPLCMYRVYMVGIHPSWYMHPTLPWVYPPSHHATLPSSSRPAGCTLRSERPWGSVRENHLGGEKSEG